MPIHIKNNGVQHQHPLECFPASQSLKIPQQPIQGNTAAYKPPQRNKANRFICKSPAFRCGLFMQPYNRICHASRICLLDQLRG